MIIASAIKHEGIVFTGKRHNEIIKYLVELGYKPPIPNSEQGFIDETGKFYYREESKEHAKKCGQINKDFGKVLTSEDLW